MPAAIPLFLLALLPALSTPSTRDGACPVDAHGRSLLDERGPIAYRVTGDSSIARHGDGSFSEASPPSASPRSELDPVRDLRSHSGYTLGPYSATHPGSWPEAVAIGDVTGDGRNDVVLTTTFYFDAANDYQVFVYAQKPDGTLDAPVKYPYLANANRNGLVLADLDEDGLRDVVVGHGSGITVLLADGLGGLKPGVVIADKDADTLAAMDVDLDGDLDVISLSWSNGASIFHGDGSGGFSSVQPLATNAAGYNDHEVEDLSGDGFPDLGVMSGQGLGPNLTVHRHDGISSFLPLPKTHSTGDLTSGLGLGDVSGDGRHDAVLSGWGNKPVDLWVFAQDAAGDLTGPTAVPSYDIPEPVEVADLDGDGREDVAVAHGGWLRLGIYLQQPAGGLEPEVLYDIPYASHYAPQGLAVGDFSGDGCTDVAIADYNYGLVTLLGQNLGGLAIPPVSPVCAGDSVVLTAVAAGGCPVGEMLLYRWRVGVNDVCPWSPSPDCTATPLGTTTYTLEARCSGGSGCPMSASVTVTVDPDLVPPDLGNTLRAVKLGASVDMSWGTEPLARTYSLYRVAQKQPWPWPGPALRSLLSLPTSVEPDVAGPPDQYLYRAVGASCSGLEGP